MSETSGDAYSIENLRIAALFGEKLRAARGAIEVSQAELSEVARLHRTEIGALERGKHLPSLETLLILGGALLVAPAELIRDLPIPQERRARGRRSSTSAAAREWRAAMSARANE